MIKFKLTVVDFNSVVNEDTDVVNRAVLQAVNTFLIQLL